MKLTITGDDPIGEPRQFNRQTQLTMTSDSADIGRKPDGRRDSRARGFKRDLASAVSATVEAGLSVRSVEIELDHCTIRLQIQDTDFQGNDASHDSNDWADAK